MVGVKNRQSMPKSSSPFELHINNKIIITILINFWLRNRRDPEKGHNDVKIN